MTITTLSSREFNQNVSKAKKQAAGGPVFIKTHGKPAYVLLTIEDYQRLQPNGRSLYEMIAQEGDLDIDFDPPKLGDFGLRIPEFD